MSYQSSLKRSLSDFHLKCKVEAWIARMLHLVPDSKDFVFIWIIKHAIVRNIPGRAAKSWACRSKLAFVSFSVAWQMFRVKNIRIYVKHIYDMSYFLWSKNALCRMPTFFIWFTLCPGSQVIKGTLGQYNTNTKPYKMCLLYAHGPPLRFYFCLPTVGNPGLVIQSVDCLSSFYQQFSLENGPETFVLYSFLYWSELNSQWGRHMK